MQVLETLFAVSLVFWGLTFAFVFWVHSRLRRLEEEVARLAKAK